MKIALVYDRVNKFGGAEKLLMMLHEIWPDAPLLTSVYSKKKAPWANIFQIKTSFLQRFPIIRNNHEAFPWLMPFAFEGFKFDDFDIVISVTSAEAKGIITKTKTLHICYCLTPTRYLWSSYHHYLNNPRFGWFNFLAKAIMKPFLNCLRKWDLIAAHRPDCYFAISKTVAGRLDKYYHRKAEVIYPAINTDIYNVGKKRDIFNYYLIVSRLVSYKRIDIAIEAFNSLKTTLFIIGSGTEYEYLKNKTLPNIKFITRRLTEEELISYYQNCRAVICCGEEDFGLVSLEAQACGKPIIAYKLGGLGETVINGKTGILFSPQTSKSLINAVEKFEKMDFNPNDCRKNAERFNKNSFLNKFKSKVEEKWLNYQKMM